MVGGLQGEEWKFIQKYLKKNIQKCRSQISGSTKDQFTGENEVCEISQTHKKDCEITSQRKADFAAAAKLAFSLWSSASNVSQLSGNFGRNSTALCKMAAKSFRNKKVISQLCKILPLAWSDFLAMAVTPSFQLRIAHRLKHWIFDFLIFEMVYRM